MNARRPLQAACTLTNVYGNVCVAGEACGAPLEDECGAPDSGLGCCFSNTQCFNNTADCAAFVKHCPFSNAGSKADRLACMPDGSDFKRGNCSQEQRTAADIPVTRPKITCYESEKLTCAIYKNATHQHVTASCKAAAANSGATAATTWNAKFATAGLGLMVSTAQLRASPHFTALSYR